MIRVFVVEDEALVRMGIRATVDRKENDYTIVGEADNGLAAVEKIESLQPDIVLLDITIPGIDGLEVLRRVRTDGYKGYILTLTCHEEFRMVQQALRSGANDYVLKSEITGENLLSYLEKIQISPTGQKDEAIAEEVLINGKRENFLSNLLLIGYIDNRDFPRACSRYQIKISETNLYFILIKIQNYHSVIQRYVQDEQQTFFTGVSKLLSDTFAHYPEHEIVRYSPDIYVVMVSFSKEVSTARITANLKNITHRIQGNLETFLNVETVLCVSRQVRNIDKSNEEFTRVKKLSQNNFFFPEEKLFWDSDDYNERDFIPLLNRLKGKLKDMLEKKIPLEPVQAVQNFLRECQKNRILPERSAFLYVINEFLGSAVQNFTLSDPRTDEEKQSMGQVMDQLSAVQNEDNASAKPQNHLVAQAVQYIDKNFMRDINLENIANSIDVSPSYFSRTFTKIMGENVSAYILDKRIEYAKHLIATTNLKHYEIAEKCGLNSSAYFASLFKKHTGVTPNQYRNKKS